MATHVLINPAARGGKTAALYETLRTRCERLFDVRTWCAPQDADEFMARAAAVPAGDLLLVAGGDGTVHTAVRGLWQSECRAVLGILPSGTGNDFAHAAGLSMSADYLDRLAAGIDRRVDLGVARVDGGQERPFANAVGSGLDAATSVRAYERVGWPSLLRYGISALEELASWKAPAARLRVDDHETAGPCTLCTIGNGPRSGGGFPITPDARIDDGRFDVCFAAGMSLRRSAVLLPQLMAGRHHGAPEITLVTGTGVELEYDAPVPVHADGEILSTAARRIEARLVPKVLRLRVPA